MLPRLIPKEGVVGVAAAAGVVTAVEFAMTGVFSFELEGTTADVEDGAVEGSWEFWSCA